MSQRMFQGRTNNHLTWTMVDATDFATPESALSAAMTVKVYGKLRGATGTNIVTSGTGSLTNDVTHVGASATGVYTIALAKADLSDASAAWYDQYTFIMGGTGAAQQVIVSEGVLAGGDVEGLSALVSDVQSALVLVASGVSDATSAAQQINSRVVVNQSLISDVQSLLVVANSNASNALSAATANTSKLVVAASTLSDMTSALAALGDASDVGSAMLAAANVVTGTCDAGGTTTAVIASATSPASGVNDQFNGRIMIFDAATTTVALRGQATDITDYVHATKTFTVTALTTAPASGDLFKIF